MITSSTIARIRDNNKENRANNINVGKDYGARSKGDLILTTTPGLNITAKAVPRSQPWWRLPRRLQPIWDYLPGSNRPNTHVARLPHASKDGAHAPRWARYTSDGDWIPYCGGKLERTVTPDESSRVSWASISITTCAEQHESLSGESTFKFPIESAGTAFGHGLG